MQTANAKEIFLKTSGAKPSKKSKAALTKTRKLLNAQKIKDFPDILDSLEETYLRLDRMTKGYALDEKDTARIYLRRYGRKI